MQSKGFFYICLFLLIFAYFCLFFAISNKILQLAMYFYIAFYIITSID
ncbi:MAG: hypothetical protein ACI4PS_06155 [Rhodocyclaceae bacterium]